jgi:hypothetical protein
MQRMNITESRSNRWMVRIRSKGDRERGRDYLIKIRYTRIRAVRRRRRRLTGVMGRLNNRSSIDTKTIKFKNRMRRMSNKMGTKTNSSQARD